jgi:hypothetical protein
MGRVEHEYNNHKEGVCRHPKSGGAGDQTDDGAELVLSCIGPKMFRITSGQAVLIKWHSCHDLLSLLGAMTLCVWPELKSVISKWKKLQSRTDKAFPEFGKKTFGSDKERLDYIMWESLRSN